MCVHVFALIKINNNDLAVDATLNSKIKKYIID